MGCKLSINETILKLQQLNIDHTFTNNILKVYPNSLENLKKTEKLCLRCFGVQRIEIYHTIFDTEPTFFPDTVGVYVIGMFEIKLLRGKDPTYCSAFWNIF